MAIIRNAANRVMKGRVGETTYYVSKGQQVARQSRNDSNYGEAARRTELQQSRRVLWANLVEFYKVSSRWMPKAFETKKPGQTDYNKFMQVNIGQSRIALTKSESVAGACVVDAYVVSQGSLPSVAIIETGSQWRTNLIIGSLTIDATTTIGALTDALVANNANVREGMQISFVSYQQSQDSLGTPRVLCRCYECTLRSASTEKVRDYLPEFCSTSVNQALGTSADISEGGFAYILSELVNGQLRVSTQQLTTVNSTMIEYYSSSTQVQAAMDSYGINTEVILSPTGTVQQQPEPVPAYVKKVAIIAGTTYNYFMPGSYIGPCNLLYERTMNIYMAGLSAHTVSYINLVHGNDQVYRATIGETAADYVGVTFASITESDTSVIKALEIHFTDDTIVYCQFRATQ